MTTRCAPITSAGACESSRKLRRLLPGLLLIVLVAASVPALAAAPPATTAPDHTRDALAEHADDEHHESPWAFAGRIFNFTLLAGTLVLLLKGPMGRYLATRSVQVRDDLVTAARMKEEASRQITTIEARLKELPRELDALRTRGREEISAEEARIEAAATAERERLLEATRREIDLQLRLVRRELLHHAADLAVHVARERIRSHITSDDQWRLVDRYMAQVQTHD